MSCNKTPYYRVIVVHVLLACITLSCSDSESQKQAEAEATSLMKFKNLLSNNMALSNWNGTLPLCTGNSSNWNGLLCQNSAFYGLQLEGMGLQGIIDVDTLASLTSLRTISLKNNSFQGPMPNVNKIGWLRSIFLSNNNFSGEIPDAGFSGMNSLRKVYLANNSFTGKIPNSLAQLPKLVNLQLEDNQFEGKIPNFQQKGLAANLANNNLEGRIPAVFSQQNPSTFAGNPKLCGKPLQACKNNKKRTIIIIVIISLGIVLICIILASLLFRGRARSRQRSKYETAKFDKNKVYKKKEKEIQLQNQQQDKYYKRSEHGKLYFVRSDRERFGLQDLLRASAEVLGSGSFGSSYKATLLGGPALVVKRFREMGNVGREEFHEHMRRLGSLSHPNLLPLVAFYYKIDEKLLITDFAKNDSLASHLHGKHMPNQPGLDWPTRLRIIKGVAQGLGYLYNQLSTLSLPHGHLKSSNVLLDDTFNPLLADYALAQVINKEHAQQFMVAYKSPEFTQYDRTTKKTDAWCLGILILEMLTGKFPAIFLKQGKGGSADLETWVNSVVREEWTGEVFDKDMKGTKNGEGEMLKLLKIGMCCCEWNVERRWDLREAIKKIDELKERDNDEDYSSYASEGEMGSSRAMTEDDFSFSVTG